LLNVVCLPDPNPRVGCLIVVGDVIVGEGWHEQTGSAHAEVVALDAAQKKAHGSTAYVTLEPCSHQGRTGPCSSALIEAGVRRVDAATGDPFPKVDGRGFDRLRDAGVHVDVGLMAAEATALNQGFFSRHQRRRPWLRLKLATSLDGRTALANGQSQWITSAAARADGHHWRARASAILTGIGTVSADDPALTARIEGPVHQPLRVVADSQFRIDPAARLLNDGGATVVVGCHTDKASADERFVSLQGSVPDSLPDSLAGSQRLNLLTLLEWLASEQQVNELHVEAGPILSGALLAEGLVDELLIYQASCILGDSARGMFSLPILESMGQRINFECVDLTPIGPDVRWRLRPSAIES